MIKQMLLGATITTALLASAPLLAHQAGQRHGQNDACTGANCATAAETQGHHAMGHGRRHGNMQAGRGEHPGKGAHGKHGGHATQGANAGEGCPMHGERKPT